MLDLTQVPEDFHAPAARVVETVLRASESLTARDVMIVGAWSRNILHRALGHTFATTATQDIDLALALASWEAYRELSAAFTQVGHTGLRYRIAGFDVDLLPFGDVEDPEGVVDPPSRDVPVSVWAFGEIFAASLPLALPLGVDARIPTVAGYAAAKLGAWLDRSVDHETKDAADLALALYWYAESHEVQERLYATSAGNETLIAEELDVQRAAAHLLGIDVAELIGPLRQSELLARWPGDAELLIANLQVRGEPAWPGDLTRRRELVDALTRGLTTSI